MTNLVNDTVQSAGRLAVDVLRSRVAWLTDSLTDLDGESWVGRALVLVLGREHYTERRRRYPPLGRRDLRNVVRQDLAASPATIACLGPVEAEHCEVVFFELAPSAVERLPRAMFVVPETVVLAGGLERGDLADVYRRGFRYFLTGSGISQPAYGAVTDPRLFAIAVGYDADPSVVGLGPDDMSARLTAGLRQLPAWSWWQFFRPIEDARQKIRWQAIAKLVGSTLIAYLVAASAYLGLVERAREAELAGLGPDVENLLNVQQQIDHLQLERAGLVRILQERRYTYIVWQFVAAAWSKGAFVSEIRLMDNRLTIQGEAPSSTEVLAVVAAIPQGSGAKFSAPVRAGANGGEGFSITIDLGGVPARD